MPNLTCQWCGQTYHTCPDCVRNNSWRAAACCEPHYQAKIIALDFHVGNITEDEARQMFEFIQIDPATASSAIGLDKCVAPLLINHIAEDVEQVHYTSKGKSRKR